MQGAINIFITRVFAGGALCLFACSTVQAQEPAAPRNVICLARCVGPDRPGEGAFEMIGSWVGTRGKAGGGMDALDAEGLPLNDEGRMRILSHDEAQLAMVERQCIGWPDYYFIHGGGFGVNISSEVDPVKGKIVAYTVGAWEDRPAMKIWMDGRPHPSKYAPHTRAGFTTGRWEGNTLVTTTTHMTGALSRSLPMSDEATLTMRFYRYGDLLTILAIVDDPVYLAEPWVSSGTIQPSVIPALPTGPPCITTYEGHAGEVVPHYLPGTNPFVDEATKKNGIPRDAVLGQDETLYPEYQKKIAAAASAK